MTQIDKILQKVGIATIHDIQMLTTSSGMPVDNDLCSMTAGPPGPTLMQDVHLLERLADFDRERIPEPVVRFKGTASRAEEGIP